MVSVRCIPVLGIASSPDVGVDRVGSSLSSVSCEMSSVKAEFSALSE